MSLQWDIIHMYTLSHYLHGYKLNSLLTYFQQGFIAQLVEHCTDIAEVMSSNPFEASVFFLGFLCDCFSCFIAVRITLTCNFLGTRNGKERSNLPTYMYTQLNIRFTVYMGDIHRNCRPLDN